MSFDLPERSLEVKKVPRPTPVSRSGPAAPLSVVLGEAPGDVGRHPRVEQREGGAFEDVDPPAILFVVPALHAAFEHRPRSHVPFRRVRPGTPTASIDAAAATWRGNSLTPQRSFRSLTAQSFLAQGNGKYGVIDTGVGPRVGSVRGRLEVRCKMGSGADTLVLAQSALSASAAPLITLGVNASGQATGSIQDATGATVAAWEFTTQTVAPEGKLLQVLLAWDAGATIDGVLHVRVRVNGTYMPASGFTVVPASNWTAFQPLYLSTGTYTETGFDGEMILTQASLVVI